MRFLLTSWGSYGDLHPFLALGRGLKARGHEVTLVGHADWAKPAELVGLRHVSTGEDLREDFIQKHPQVLSRKMAGLVSLRTLVSKAIAPGFDGVLKTLLAEIPAHDALVAHHFVFPAPVAAELSGIPWATVSLAPGVVPSAYTLPGGNFGRPGTGWLDRQRNRVVWSTGRCLIAPLIDPAVNRMRAAHGLAPVRDAMFSNHSARLNLQLYSGAFVERPPDWSPEKKIAGFCFYDPPDAPHLAPEVEDFLARGEPPILFTLGSAAVHLPGNFFYSAVTAVQRLGLRGLLLVGPEVNRPANLPDSILAISYAPYGPLMPRVRAVVHQCGIGTLSHTLRAGVPSVACPFAFDQPNNARRLEAHGLAEVLLPHQHTVAFIEKALRRLLAGDAAARARTMGEKIRAEDGVDRACAILEETFPG